MKKMVLLLLFLSRKLSQAETFIQKRLFIHTKCQTMHKLIEEIITHYRQRGKSSKD